MSIPPKTQLALLVGSLVAVLIVAVGAMSLYWLPSMSTTHAAIHQREAAIAAIQRQQDNLADLSRQLTERQSEEVRLNKEMWGFLQEDTFFEMWDTYGDDHDTTITLETLDDGAPGPIPTPREATIKITGSLTNILQTMASIPTISPTVVIRQVEISAGGSDGLAIARITCSTLWYDDTLR